MEFKTQAQTEVIFKGHYIPDFKQSFDWKVEMITRGSVGVNLSVVPKLPESLEVTCEDDDCEEYTKTVSLSGFEFEVEYRSVSDNSIGIGLHLESVIINCDRKRATFLVNTNNF